MPPLLLAEVIDKAADGAKLAFALSPFGLAIGLAIGCRARRPLATLALAALAVLVTASLATGIVGPADPIDLALDREARSAPEREVPFAAGYLPWASTVLGMAAGLGSRWSDAADGWPEPPWPER